MRRAATLVVRPTGSGSSSIQRGVRRFSSDLKGLDGVIAPIVDATGPPNPAHVKALARAMPPIPVSIDILRRAAKNASQEQLLLNAKFIRRELVARRALGLSWLLAAEQGGPGLRLLAKTPGVKDLREKYWQRLQRVLRGQPLVTSADEEQFSDQLAAENDFQDGETRIAFGTGLAAVSDADKKISYREEVEISSFLDAFLSARVGIRLLTEHYLATKEPRAGFVGLIQEECNPVHICRALCAKAEQTMHETYGAAPKMEVVGDEAQTFTFVPQHFEFVLGVLIDNAAKATIRRTLERDEGRLTTLPPVRVIMAASDQHVTVKVADQGGGIPRSKLADMWSYRGQAKKRWSKGHGLGLPLARIYATYFGGSMDAVPMEGHGTDCYVVFNKVMESNRENFLKVPKAAPESEPELVERPRQGKWRAAIRLFDAQARNWEPPPPDASV